SRSTSLTLTEDDYHSGRLQLALTSGGDITAQVSGGVIGGLLDARREVLDPAEEQLGRMAIAITSAVNDQNHAGIDLRGQLGGDLFAPITGTALQASANTGNATAQVGIADAGAITGDDYQLKYDGSSWSMTNASTGAAVALSGSGTAADPLTGAGISITLAGTPAAGDRFLVEPARQAASQVQLATTDTSAIAAAAPVSASAATGNTGTATISAPTVLDAGNAALMSGVTIAFTSATTYSINGSGSYTYSAGGNIDFNGWRVQIKGAPATGDTFSISANGANSGDNRNARAMSALSSAGVLDGGLTSVTSANAALVSSTGSTAQQASLRANAQNAILGDTQKQRDSVSGVNLDEEAADLVRFQQAYQAAARIIQVADTVFQSLLQAAQG
ncbi:MAG TPA: flagellar basal body rod C-terminal domain-containing protein, partial [Nevskiaceae bacterium]|nr:flagellar basal body rod C-terminal domain-containing protein [Nevskiaceae bacterium]